MEGFIRFITDPQNLLSIGVGVLVFATVLTLLSSMTGGVKLDKRMKAVAERRDDLKRRSRAGMAAGQGARASHMAVMVMVAVMSSPRPMRV